MNGKDTLPLAERREFPGQVGVIVCMDEDITYGENVIVFGVAGTALAKVGPGDQQLFPDKSRRLTSKVRPAMFKALQSICNLMSLPLVSTSHINCGWAGAQGIDHNDVPGLTKALSQASGIDYLGHIQSGPVPAEVGNSNVCLSLNREATDHHHKARRIVVTVGGGITQGELELFEADNYGDAFIISADWLSAAVDVGQISAQEALDFIALQIDIADGIADGVNSGSCVTIWTEGNLPKKMMRKNLAMVKKMLRDVFPKGEKR